MLNVAWKTLLFCSGIFLCFTVSTANAFMGMEKKQTELNHITGHIEELKKSLSASQSQQTKLENQLKTTELTLNQLSDDLADLDEKLAVEEKRLDKLTQIQQKYLEKLAEQRAALATQIRLMYKLGNSRHIKNILNPDDVNSISRHIFYYHYLSDARVKLVAEINQILVILNQNLAEIKTQETHLKNLRERKEQQLRQERVAQAKRQQIIASLNASNQDKQHQLEALLTDQNGLQKTLIGLQTQTPEELYQSFKQAHGKLGWPIEGHKISATAFENSDSHQSGIIIKAPEGTPVHAIFGGKVIFANWLRGFGLLIIINHGNGFMSLYARNHAIYAKVGDRVKPREIIASIGNTGGYSASSLYFEIRQNGLPVNPTIWCR